MSNFAAAAARVISNTPKYDSGLIVSSEFCGMKSCTGSTSLTGCATSWQYWHTVRYMAPLHSTWQASSRRRRRSLDVSTCDLLLNRNWSFHGAVGRRLAVGHFRWQVRQSGMHYRTVSEIQSWHFQASFEDLLLHVILDVSHVQHIWDFLVMRYINVRFTLLTINRQNWSMGVNAATTDQWASMLQGLDCPTENALGLVKTGKALSDFDPPTNSILAFQPQMTMQSFIKFDWGYRGGSPTAIQTWPCPLCEPPLVTP